MMGCGKTSDSCLVRGRRRWPSLDRGYSIERKGSVDAGGNVGQKERNNRSQVA